MDSKSTCTRIGIIFAMVLQLIGCSDQVGFVSGPTPSSCSVKQTVSGPLLSCSDGTAVFIPGGRQGYGAGVKMIAATTCPAGSNGGVELTTFVDKNNNGLLDTGETATAVSIVCGGLPGTNGQSSAVSVTAASITDCLTGGYLLTIQNGSSSSTVAVCDGAVGPQGQQGPQGNNGSNGTVVTPVQFCPNYVGSYPGTFPEYGLRVGNVIYAVYWDSTNAWFGALYPGSYRSTSTGAPCNFSVNADGSISN